MTETDGRVVRRRVMLTMRQRKRLDRIKSECAGDYTPEPSDREMISSLLDTWDAVGEGHYSECDCDE